MLNVHKRNAFTFGKEGIKYFLERCTVRKEGGGDTTQAIKEGVS